MERKMDWKGRKAGEGKEEEDEGKGENVEGKIIWICSTGKIS